jgi:hypothetical protein
MRDERGREGRTTTKALLLRVHYSHQSPSQQSWNHHKRSHVGARCAYSGAGAARCPLQFGEPVLLVPHDKPTSVTPSKMRALLSDRVWLTALAVVGRCCEQYLVVALSVA